LDTVWSQFCDYGSLPYYKPSGVDIDRFVGVKWFIASIVAHNDAIQLGIEYEVEYSAAHACHSVWGNWRSAFGRQRPWAALHPPILSSPSDIPWGTT